MKEYDVSSYGIFGDAIGTTNTFNAEIQKTSDDITSSSAAIKDDSVFMGPIADDCRTQIEKLNVLLSSNIENFTTITSYLATSLEKYIAGDTSASSTVINSTTDTTDTTSSLNVNSESTANKDINTDSIKSGTNVYNAVNKYSDELNKAEYATVNENLFTTTTTEYINGQPVKITHVVINDGS